MVVPVWFENDVCVRARTRGHFDDLRLFSQLLPWIGIDIESHAFPINGLKVVVVITCERDRKKANSTLEIGLNKSRKLYFAVKKTLRKKVWVTLNNNRFPNDYGTYELHEPLYLSIY